MFPVGNQNTKTLLCALGLLCLSMLGARASESILKSFSNSYVYGAYPVGQFALNGGAFYGVTQYGIQGYGDIYKMTTTGAISVLHEFVAGAADGAIPTSGMIYAGGSFYGTTVYGGTANAGVFFRITPGGSFTLLHSFTGYNNSNPSQSDGANPYGGLLLASDGNIYGITYVGGSSNQGTVYMVNPSTGSYSLVHNFKSSSDTAANPYTGMAEGADGALYGASGYAAGYNGGLYKMNKDGSGYAFVHGFDSSDVAGYTPASDLLTASDGNLYGVCQSGGAWGLGTVFKLVTSSGNVSALWNFDGYTGAFPGNYSPGTTEQVRLTQGTDHNLYGVTTYGGYYDYGTAFKLTLAGACAALTNFNYGDTFGTANPLTQSGTSFYCTSYYGGIFTNVDSTNGYGAALSIGSTGVIKPLQTFYQRDAWNPYAGLVQSGTAFYGEAGSGGEFNNGYLYSITSAGHLTILHQMNDNTYFWEGNQPAGGLLLDSGSFYGMTETGGKYGGGTLFKITTKGAFSILHHLVGTRDGYAPYSAPTAGAGTDKNLYGALTSGSLRNFGSIFSTNVTGTTFRVIHYFTGSDGAYPECTPVPDGAGSLWGTCFEGGAHGYGTIWKLSTDGSAFTKVYDFDNTHGAYPWYAGHLYLINGILYGTVRQGGANNAGVLFAFNTATSALSLLHTFDNNSGFLEGYYPVGLYYDAAGGNFYGCCEAGGANNDGTVWKIALSS